jgi:rhodanese-related sulfurtransferase
MRPGASSVLQALALLGAAVLCALISNAAADHARHLSWTPVPTELPVPLSPLPPPAPIAPRETPAAPSATQNRPARPAPSPKPAAPQTLQRFAPDPTQPIRAIHSDDAWALFRSGVPFLDARRGEDFAAGHIAGARNLAVWESDVDARITEFEATVKPSFASPLVLYCSGGECEDSHLLASKLLALGYRNLLIYQEGFPDWTQRNHPVRKGDQP